MIRIIAVTAAWRDNMDIENKEVSVPFLCWLSSMYWLLACEVQCNLNYPNPFVHRLIAAIPDK